MPQPDLESPVTGVANDRKISSEAPENDVIPDEHEVPPAAESFWLSKDAEYDWFNHSNFVDRNDSVNNNTNSTHSNQQLNPRSNSIVNLKSKSFIIGLFKAPKTTVVDTKRRSCKPANIRLFPKRIDSAGKPAVPVAEPGSPKVSCMGRVRSKRGCRRSISTGKDEKPVDKTRTGSGEEKKIGIYFKILSMFRFKTGPKKLDRSRSRKVAEEAAFVEPARKSVSVVGGLRETPGLGEMKCFASGRRSGAWTAEEFNLGEVDRRVSFSGGA